MLESENHELLFYFLIVSESQKNMISLVHIEMPKGLNSVHCMWGRGPGSLGLAVLHPVWGCSFLASTVHEHFEQFGQFGSVGKNQRPDFCPWLFAKLRLVLKSSFPRL